MFSVLRFHSCNILICNFYSFCNILIGLISISISIVWPVLIGTFLVILTLILQIQEGIMMFEAWAS